MRFSVAVAGAPSSGCVFCSVLFCSNLHHYCHHCLHSWMVMLELSVMNLWGCVYTNFVHTGSTNRRNWILICLLWICSIRETSQLNSLLRRSDSFFADVTRNAFTSEFSISSCEYDGRWCFVYSCVNYINRLSVDEKHQLNSSLLLHRDRPSNVLFSVHADTLCRI